MGLGHDSRHGADRGDRLEAAGLIRAYEPQVVPGLLQTEGYILAITAASFPPRPVNLPNGP